jgi:hypothetical protein
MTCTRLSCRASRDSDLMSVASMSGNCPADKLQFQAYRCRINNMPLFFCGTVAQSRPRKSLNLQGLSTDIPSAAVVQIVHPRHSMPKAG